MKRAISLLVLCSGMVLPAAAQRQGGQFAGPEGGQGVMGTVTAVQGDTLSIKTMDGEQWQVIAGANTRISHEREPAKLADVKPGFGVMAFGQKDTAQANTVRAVFVAYQTAAEVSERMATFGKTWIAGTVKSINGTSITLDTQMPGHIGEQTQVIAVDENTSFRKGPESVTLADIHPGDRVMGQGQVKNGVFTPATLQVRPAGERGHRAGGPPPGVNAGAGQPPQDKAVPPPTGSQPQM